MRPSVGGAGRLAQSEGSRGRGPQLGPAPSSAGVLAAFSQVTACPKLSAQGLAPNPLPALEPPLALPGLRQGLCMAGQPPALSLCPASWESFSETHLAILHPVFPTVTRVPPAYISIVLGGPSASRLADGRSISRAQEGGRGRPSARRTRLIPWVLLGCRLVLQPGRCTVTCRELVASWSQACHFLSLEDSGHLVSPEVLGGFPEPAGSMKCRAHGAVPSLPSESRHFREGRWGTHFRVPPWFVQPVLLGRQAACLGDRIT